MRHRIAIAHAAWDSRRETAFRELETKVSPDAVFTSEEPERSHVWAKRIWRYVAQAPENDLWIVLNDDVDVCPHFREVLTAQIVGCPAAAGHRALHTTHEAAPGYDQPWIRSYWMTGPGYELTPYLAQMMLAFWDSHPELTTDANEDIAGIYWAYENRVPFWHPIPAIVRHRTEVPSTLGYDKHPHRVTNVPWDHPLYENCSLTEPTYWALLPKRVEIPWMTDSQLRKLRNC
jgi:hypothetical protein